MSPFTEDDGANAERKAGKPRPKGKIPYPPHRDEPLTTVREWLSDAAGLPLEVRIETVIRAGTEPEDPITITLSNGIAMRCPHQSRLQQGRTLQAFFVSASDGIAMPHYLSPVEVGDFYTGLCRMNAAAAHADPIADLRERLAMFTELCDPLHGSLGSRRYATLEAMKMRPVYDRAAAENRTPTTPVMLVDTDANRRYIRASEWVAYLRFVHGQVVDESRLVARMGELRSERVHPQAWNSDRTRKLNLVLYTVPQDV